ncbi:DUF6064 family protein [Spiribacter halobius]|uniref:MFS transporter permease n=1 Tax=Sediminicurvatus halobius TaxID=2182432 RepID=A0A2U2N8Q1_9GAMM|nr:DUF6064 family protein [Spiribacter halobius]PWG65452.1 hypothetical protein DEM34_01545 [Spiribacter halobius]UEX76473.1 DUF6064 family protein [Spiribacter halobius]
MLPYTAEVLDALLADYHAAIAPLRVIGWLLTAIALALAWRGGPTGWRGSCAVLAAGWLWTGIAFHYERFAVLNFAAPAYAGLFGLQAALLLVTGALAGRPGTSARGALAWIGLAVAAFALLGQPALAAALGASWQAVPMAGTAPTPTALATLGILLLAARTPIHLCLLPALWGLIAGASGWILGMPRELPLALVALALPGLLWWQRRSRPERKR